MNPHSKLSELKKGKRRYDAVCEDLNKDPSVPVFREAFVAPTTQEAFDIARLYLKQKYDRYVEWGQDEAIFDGDNLRELFDTLAEDRFLIGTPTEVCEKTNR